MVFLTAGEPTNYKQWDNDVEEWEKLMLLDKHRKVGL